MTYSRRGVIAGAGYAAAAASGLGRGDPLLAAHGRDGTPMVDTHIHLFDPTRPQGAPYRGPRNSPVYETGSSPAAFRQVMAPYNAVAAIHVDASPWVEDNLWMLDAAHSDPIMVGAIGNLRVEDPGFGDIFGRFARNPLFLGLRYGNLWGYDIVEQSANAAFIEGLRLLRDADLVLDTANPRIDLLQAMIRINDALPDLRIVIDHLCKLDPLPQEQRAYMAALEEIADRPSLYVKLSSSLHAGNADPALSAHKERLDLLYGTFGPDRVLYASDWPNVEGDAPVGQAITLIQSYMAGKTVEEQARFFWGNSVKAYKWKARTPAQQALLRG